MHHVTRVKTVFKHGAILYNDAELFSLPITNSNKTISLAGKCNQLACGVA